MCLLYLWWLNAKRAVWGTYSNRTVTFYWLMYVSVINITSMHAMINGASFHSRVHQHDNFNIIMYLISFRRFECIPLAQWGVSIELTPFMNCSWYTTKLCPNYLWDAMHSDLVNWSNQVITQLATVACMSVRYDEIYSSIQAYHVQYMHLQNWLSFYPIDISCNSTAIILAPKCLHLWIDSSYSSFMHVGSVSHAVTISKLTVVSREAKKAQSARPTKKTRPLLWAIYMTERFLQFSRLFGKSI